MASEYIRISGTERLYSTKYLLQSELELLGTVQHIKNYKKLRREELELKIKLKAKISEILTDIKEFEKAMPKTKIDEDFEEKVFRIKEVKEMTKENEVEKELERIKNKLAALG